MIAHALVLFVLPALLLAAAAWDITSFTIPNFLQAGLLAVFALLMAIHPIGAGALGMHLLAGFIGLVAGFTLFSLDRGSRTVRARRSATTAPGTAPEKNAACHPQRSAITPPKPLPSPSPTALITATIESARPRHAGEKCSATKAWVVGRPADSPKPTPKRAASSPA